MKLIFFTIALSFFGLCPVLPKNHTESPTEAYIEGDYIKLKRLIAEGINLDKPDYNGKTALILAAYDGNEKIVELLIKKGAKVNEDDEDGRTALIYAIYDGNEDIVHLLIDNGAKVNVIDNDGRTPLIWASIEGHIEIARLLIPALAKELELKAKEEGQSSSIDPKNIDDAITDYVNIADDDGKTALNWATQEGYSEIVKFLIGNRPVDNTE